MPAPAVPKLANPPNMEITTAFSLYENVFILHDNVVRQATIKALYVRVAPTTLPTSKTKIEIKYAVQWDQNTRAAYSEGGKFAGMQLPDELPEDRLFTDKAALLQSL